MIKKALITAICLMMGAAAGCTGSKHLSSTYGRTSAAMFKAQVINPNAPDDRTPVEGMPGYEAVQIYNDIYLPQMTDSETAGGE